MGCSARMLASRNNMRPKIEISCNKFHNTKRQIFQTRLQGSLECNTKLQMHPDLQHSLTANLSLSFSFESNILISLHIFLCYYDKERTMGPLGLPMCLPSTSLYYSMLGCIHLTNWIWQRGYIMLCKTGINLSLSLPHPPSSSVFIVHFKEASCRKTYSPQKFCQQLNETWKFILLQLSLW